MPIALILTCLTVAALQDKKGRPDDVIQLKDEVGGGIRVGRISSVDETGVDIVLRGRKDPIRILFTQMIPYSVYRIKADRIDADDAEAHMKLGDFCRGRALYTFAIREYRQAMALDPSLKDAAIQKIYEARSEDARAKFEEAKRLALKKKFRDASDLYTTIITKYSDTPYFEDAKKEIEKITKEIEAENAKKKNAIEAKKKAGADKKAKAKEDLENALLGKCAQVLDEAKKAWAEGLDWEGKDNLTKADRAWKAAEALVLRVRRTLDSLLKSNDVTMLQRSKELDKQATGWLVKIYYRLGAMWAVQLNYRDGRLYLNKALKLPHDAQMDHLINETLLTLNQLLMRQRAAGKGY